MQKNRLGGWFIAGLVVLNWLLWLIFPPPDDGREHFGNQMVAEMFSTSALILMASSIFLTLRPRWVEVYFGGLDKMYRTHRTIAITVGLLLLAHFLIVAVLSQRFHLDPSLAKVAFLGLQVSILLALAPRIPVIGKYFNLAYHRWKPIHRLTGIFFIVGILHSLRIENVMQLTRPVYYYVLAIAFVGALLYLYKELVEPLVKKRSAYRVEALRRLPGPVTEVTLAPRNGSLRHRSGQFLLVDFPRTRGLNETHPFTISSAPGENRLRLTIKGSGDFTRRLAGELAEGAEARVEGAYGLFDYRSGGPRQIWVAGGIGLTPFLSWVRDFDGQPGPEIDFYYTVRSPEEALFLEEFEQAQAGKSNFHFYLHCSGGEGRLSVEKIATTSGPVTGKEVYLCGPLPMILDLERQFIRGGVTRRSIHYEEFSFR